ncbi:hypothetical protein KSD_71970 [Ktedonobacter sp. SOSP1-85]|uniref:hypothetical protein n=1 Tax=Ktedonobacter sp. SOSP1-85 TaxID=2778367 RepID=UPI0019155F2C|nr:hypothetical protein [Ktedonobacter sp. SOSP1-85]GHO79426.1 hypothetical protein KSD_71970 [Ktedonobacter sp. SOSP1-85]
MITMIYWHPVLATTVVRVLGGQPTLHLVGWLADPPIPHPLSAPRRPSPDPLCATTRWKHACSLQQAEPDFQQDWEMAQREQGQTLKSGNQCLLTLAHCFSLRNETMRAIQLCQKTSIYAQILKEDQYVLAMAFMSLGVAYLRGARECGHASFYVNALLYCQEARPLAYEKDPQNDPIDVFTIVQLSRLDTPLNWGRVTSLGTPQIRGRITMDTSKQFCPNPMCSARGKMGEGTITGSERESSGLLSRR